MLAGIRARLSHRVGELKRVAELSRGMPLEEFADYDEYWEWRGQVTVLHERWKIARDLIPDGSSVLDVGCGTGRFLAFLQGERPNCELRGLDVSERAVEMARSEGVEASLHDVEAADITWRADYVTCLEVIEHVVQAERVLDRLMAARRRQAIISIPNVGFIGCRIRLALFGRFPTTCCVFHTREHVRFWTNKDFEEWIERCGYRLSARHPQHGVWVLWRLFPSLFASGMVYVVE
jgi:methionine biosynthesis protein MetW